MIEESLNNIEKESILSRADEMLRGMFRFEGVWDMEPCSVPVLNRKLRWDVTYNGDPEWTYMFTRMDYLYVLALASAITGKRDYYCLGLKIIGKWERDNRMYLKGGALNVLRRRLHKRNSLAYRSLDVAIMASNIVDYVSYGVAHGLLEPRKTKGYYHLVRDVTDYVLRNSDYDRKAFMNWGILENGNVVYCLLKTGYDKKLSEAGSRLIRQVYNQILSDGSQIESSPMYLVEILLILLKVMNIPGCAFREELSRPVRKGCEYIRDIRTLDNCIPAFGDSDRTNISDLMLIAAHILRCEDFKYYADRLLDPEYCYKYHMERETLPENIVDEKSEHINFRDQVVFRSLKDGSYLLCSNTPRCHDAHKHYDYMSVIYSEFGKDVLIDAGRYSYKNFEYRRILKGPSRHNTIAISNDSFYKYISSFVTKEKIECLENRVLQGDGWLSVRMQCVLGYSEVMISRYVTYVYSAGLLVTDVIKNNASASYQYETFFNIGQNFTAQKGEDNICLMDKTGNSLTYRNDMLLPVDIEPIQYSPKYNELLPAVQLYIRSVGEKITHSFLRKGMNAEINYSDTAVEYAIPECRLSIAVTLD